MRSKDNNPRLASKAACIVLSSAALALAACSEIPQDARKPFAGPEETRSYAADKKLDERAQTQDEYLITQDARKEPALAKR
jgi:starvation-inducible outer membrane lipoprotein